METPSCRNLIFQTLKPQHLHTTLLMSNTHSLSTSISINDINLQSSITVKKGINLIPSRQEFWFIPLGGTGEIGMNLNLYGHNGRWIIVDCGITFEDRPDDNGIMQSRIEMPLIDFASEQRDRSVGKKKTKNHIVCCVLNFLI